MVVPFLPFFIRELGVTDPQEAARWSGLAFSGPFALSFIMTPIWGNLGDKYGRKAMVVRAIIGLAISQFLIGLSTNVYELIAFRLLQGAISGFIASALALVSAGSPREKSGYAIGILQTSISSGMIIGPLIGGFLADITSFKGVFFITSILCTVSGILIILFVKEPKGTESNKKYSILDNYRFSFSAPKIRLALISITVVQIALSMSQPIFALFTESIVNNKEYISTIAGSLFGITGVATVVASPWWGRRHDSKGFKKNIILAITVSALALILHSFCGNVYELYPLRIFLGLGVAGIVPMFYSLISKNISQERKGGIMGIASSFTLLGNLIGPLLCTLLIFATEFRYIFLFSGLILFINAIFIRKSMFTEIVIPKESEEEKELINTESI